MPKRKFVHEHLYDIESLNDSENLACISNSRASNKPESTD